ncbi:MAG TPA: serine protease, partial [Erythrobacter sp.]|nr:serine protease [Erythrobacter sp.]
GNSGGPLLDGCGRVLGVNSFGADSGGSDAEFFFAVSTRELLPFLQQNGIEASVNALPCRSLDELEADERTRLEQERAEARELIAAREAELRDRRERATLEAQIAVLDARDNAMVLILLALMLASGTGYVAWQSRGHLENRRRVRILAAIATASVAAAFALWLTRPGIAEIDARVAAALDETGANKAASTAASGASEGTMLCTLVPERSRVTGSRTDDVEFDWGADGCVNGRTQYGLNSGEWTRVLVPDDEDAVSINRYDPETRTFESERYLLGRNAMAQARTTRDRYAPPQCTTTDAARVLGDQQQAIIAQLPAQPNERLVYRCAPSSRRAGSPLSSE